MAEVTKYQLITNNNTNIISDLKPYFSVFKTRKSSSFIYGIVLVFVLFTVFLAFSPSSSSSSPWFVNIFAVNSTSPADESDRSNLPSVYSFFFPNSTQSSPQVNPSRSQINATFQVPMSNNSQPISQNLNNTQLTPDKVGNFEKNNSTIIPTKDQTPQISTNNIVANPEKQINHSSDISPQISPLQRNQSSETVTQSSELSANQTVVHQSDMGSEISPQISPLQRNFSSETVTESSELSGNKTAVHQSDKGSEISPQISPLQKNHSSEVSLEKSQPQQNNTIVDPEKQSNQSSSTITPQNPSNSTKKGSGLEVNSSDLAASLSKNQGKTHANDSVSRESAKKKGNEVANLVGCDLYDGGWVRDETYPLYKPGSCKLIDEQFNCFLNGRPDNDYQKLKWKPKGCSLPRLNGGHMLELLRGKRLVFVGDSLNRNMWESLVCILKDSVKDKKKVYEAFGRHHFRTEASYSFVFKDYNCTVEFFVSPFLVQQWEVKDKNGTTQETLRLDLMVSDADQFKSADYIVFNTGHWWTHDKTSKGEDYYQEGSHVYKQLDVTEAFRRAITTWGRWVDANINPQKTHVLFRGYSASHFSGGQWNSGGQCDSETEPIKNDTYLTEYPLKMKVFESVIKGMKIPVSYLNVTRLTDYRKDGHPSVYRKQHLSGDEKKSPLRYQDCSHWCLPGVPDSWNELLYAELLRKQYSDQQQKNKT